MTCKQWIDIDMKNLVSARRNSQLLEGQLSTVTTLAVSAYQNHRFACCLRLLAVLIEQVIGMIMIVSGCLQMRRFHACGGYEIWRRGRVWSHDKGCVLLVSRLLKIAGHFLTVWEPPRFLDAIRRDDECHRLCFLVIWKPGPFTLLLLHRSIYIYIYIYIYICPSTSLKAYELWQGFLQNEPDTISGASINTKHAADVSNHSNAKQWCIWLRCPHFFIPHSTHHKHAAFFDLMTRYLLFCPRALLPQVHRPFWPLFVACSRRLKWMPDESCPK